MDFEVAPIREEVLVVDTIYRDPQTGSLIVREPYNFDGHRVISRQTQYIGTTTVNFTDAPPLNIQFPIEASSLREAFEKWPAVGKEAIKGAIDQLQSQALRRSILAPGKKGT